MARSRRRRTAVSRSAATACYALGTTQDSPAITTLLDIPNPLVVSLIPSVSRRWELRRHLAAEDPKREVANIGVRACDSGKRKTGECLLSSALQLKCRVVDSPILQGCFYRPETSEC